MPIQASGAQATMTCDVKCLMNIGSGLVKRNSSVKAMDLMEALATIDDKLPAGFFVSRDRICASIR